MKKDLSISARAQYEYCKGQEKGSILLLWEMTGTGKETINELADALGVENDKGKVAEKLASL